MQSSHVGEAKWKISGQIGAGTGLGPGFDMSGTDYGARGIYGRSQPAAYEEFTHNGVVEYRFDPYSGRGDCNVCGIDLTSLQLKEQHITGKNHAKATQRHRMISQMPMSNPAPAPTSAMQSMNMPQPSVITLGRNKDMSESTMDSYNTAVQSMSSANIEQRGPLQLGLDSENKHDHADNQADVYTMEFIHGETWFKCKVCADVKTNTLAVMQNHLIGSKHKKNLEKQGHKDTTGLSEKDLEGLNSMMDGINIDEDDDTITTEFADGTLWYVCRVCAIKVNSKDQLKLHKTGSKHIKMVKQNGGKMLADDAAGKSEAKFVVSSVKPNIEETEGQIWMKEMVVGQLWFTCLVCKVKMNTLDTLKVHMGGTKHMKNMKYFHYLSPPKPQGDGDGVDGNNANVKLELANRNEEGEIMGVAGERKLGGMEGRGWHTEYNMGTLWYVCDVCNVRMNSEDILKVHQMGSKHMRNEQQWKLTHGCSDGLGTLIGNVQGVVEGMGESNGMKTWRKETGPAGMWYVCEVCDVKMNTYEQLKIHQVGTKHMKNERRLHTLGTTDGKQENGSNDKDHSDQIKNEEPVATESLALVSQCPQGCFFHCPVCDIHCSGPVPRDQHLASVQHKKNITKKSAKPIREHNQSTSSDRRIPDPDEFCDACEFSFTGRGALEAHLKTKYHQERMARKENPNKKEDWSMIKKYVDVDEGDGEANDGERWKQLTNTAPRDYQVELFKKAMIRDSLCFMPTGQ